MGALTSNRKRPDESFSLYTPPSLNSPISNLYTHPIDTRNPKKPKLSPLTTTKNPNCSNSATQGGNSVISRVQRYPEPTRKPTREVHAPIRSFKSGFLSNSGGLGSGFAGRVKEKGDLSGLGSGFVARVREEVEDMGNTLFRAYEVAKRRAIGTLRHVRIPEETIVEEPPFETGGVAISEDSSDVQIIENWNEVRSVSTDHQMGVEVEPDGLGLGLESGSSEKRVLENGVCSEMSDLTKVEETKKMLGSMSLGRDAYKDLLASIDRNYNDKLDSLKFKIAVEETRLGSFKAIDALKQELDELRKEKEEPKKVDKDYLREPFVALTKEEQEQVAKAFSNANRRRVLVTHENSNIQITGEILQCLRPGAWLNDEVINLYLELLKERERREPEKFLNCHFFNTFFYKKLIGGRSGYDYKSVRRWTTQKKLGYGLIDCDKIFVPIHKDVHWCLAVINKVEKKFQYLDSLGGRDAHVLKVLARYLVDEVKDKSGQDIDVSSWDREYVDDLPEQQNGYDCGVFMIKYADFYSRGMGLHFSQENMPYFRVRTAKEILKLRAE